MRILVTGASGFVGSRLVAALDGEGHEVRAMTRRPGRYEGAGRPIAGDVGEERSLREALEGCEAAYYLVHSLDHPDFERKDADAARAFARAAAATGIDRIVYLGGLGQDSDQLSRHLRSRREVERLLGGTGVPVTVLRAGIVVGHGGVSWELTRQLVAHLPAMVTPRWVSTRTQPIAVADVVRYLVGVLDAPEAAGRVFEVGGPEVLTYLQMMTRVAEIQNRHLFVVPVPLLSPQLSSRWLALVTDVDVATGRSLIDSMTNEVVVTDDSIRSVVPFEPMDYDEMVMTALVERARERRRQAGERRSGWLSRGARR
ncbi:MAG: NAD(P)H-binding protein [Geodermatophilales bacterium]|nr:NAD(P)H-binding protein [Geodermatophilales bacterium]